MEHSHHVIRRNHLRQDRALSVVELGVKMIIGEFHGEGCIEEIRSRIGVEVGVDDDPLIDKLANNTRAIAAVILYGNCV